MRHLLLSVVFLFTGFLSFSQNTGIGVGTTTPHPSAELDVSSTSRGFLPPRMTTAQRNSIQNPENGLQIYNTTTDCLEIFSKGWWQQMFCGTVDTTLITDIDGKTYPTVKICDQTWMAKNLDVTRYRNGDTIPQVTDPTQWANLTTGAWCWYNNDSANGAVYGKLYNWYAVNDPRGLAPAGWHIPSDAEWNILVKCTDPNVDTSILGWQNSDAGGKLKSTSYWNAPNTGAINSLQFNALPGGRCFSSGSFSNLNNNGYWWSSSEYTSQFAWMRYLSYSNADIHRFQFNKLGGFSVRCVKDTPITTLNNGLVAYYPFSGNAGDSSGNGNHGVVNGATLTADRFGNANKAYSFDGVNDFIDLTSLNLSISNLNSLTITMWINTVSPITDNGTFFSNWKQFPNNGSVGIQYSNRNGYLSLSMNHTTGVLSQQSGIYSANIWSLLTIIFNGNEPVPSQRIRFFLDNNLQVLFDCANINYDCNFPTLANTQANRTLCGASTGGNPFTYDFFRGKIDDIRIYNRVLSQAEITYLATH